MGVLAFFNLAPYIERGYTCLVETGTGFGNGVDYARSYPFEKILSVEIDLDQAKSLSVRYGDDKRIHIYSAFSPDFLSYIFNNGVIAEDEKCIFWLDAHFPGADLCKFSHDAEKDLNKRLPLENELEMLWTHKRFHDVIIVDDLRIYRRLPIGGGDLEKIGLGHLASYDKPDFFARWNQTHILRELLEHEGYIIMEPR